MDYKVYLDERRTLVDAKYEEGRLFNKSILTLAAGAFGLSLTFIGQIAPKHETVYMLKCSWVCFLLSIIITLISFRTGHDACKRQIEIIEEKVKAERMKANSKKSNTQDKESEPKNRLTFITRRLNIASLVFFIIGILYLICFGSYNLRL